MRRLALALVAVLVAAAALSACGGTTTSTGPSTADYQKSFAPIDQRIKDIGNSVGDAVVNAKSKSTTELATEFAGLSAQVRTVAADLAALDAPDAIKAQQTALTSALGDAARSLRSISAAATAADARAAKAATVKLAAVDSPKIKQARLAIEKQLGAAS